MPVFHIVNKHSENYSLLLFISPSVFMCIVYAFIISALRSGYSMIEIRLQKLAGILLLHFPAILSFFVH